MTSEPDIFRVAKLLIDQHGEDISGRAGYPHACNNPIWRMLDMVRGSISRALLTVSMAAGIAVTAMPAEAGTAGPVWAKTKTHYSYCFGGNQGTVYFSGVIALAPTERNPELHVPFDKYILQTYGPN